MARLKLTDAAVRRLKSGRGERTDHYDPTLAGFGLRVAGPTARAPEGRKSWMLYHRFGGAQKRLTLGTYPALGLADARRQAGDALQLLSAGLDPADARAAADAERRRPRETVAQAAERFLKDGMRLRKGRALASRYIAETRRNIENHVLPRWKDRSLESITRRDVRALLTDVAAGVVLPSGGGPRIGRARGGPIAGNRTLSALGAMFTWAVREELVAANPCALAEPPGQERQGERILSCEELREVWEGLEEYGYPFGTFLQVALLTGQRRIEVAGMRWDDVDLSGRLWKVRLKGGRLNAVPLSEPVVEILEALPRKAGRSGSQSPFVFTTAGTAPISGFSRAKSSIDDLISARRTARGGKALNPWVIHDLRRTVATGLGGLKITEAIISKICGHAPKGVTNQIYNLYEYIDEKRHALDAWSAHVRQVLESPRSGSPVPKHYGRASGGAPDVRPEGRTPPPGCDAGPGCEKGAKVAEPDVDAMFDALGMIECEGRISPIGDGARQEADLSRRTDDTAPSCGTSEAP